MAKQKKKNVVLGLDLGSTSIKAVEMTREGDHLSVTGCRLVPALEPCPGLPVLPRLSSVHMPPPLPRWKHEVLSSLSSFMLTAFPIFPVGRLPRLFVSRIAQRSLALRPAHSPSPLWTLFTEGFSHFVTSMTAPIATGRSKSCRVGFSPTVLARLYTAHWKLNFFILDFYLVS